LQLILGGLLYSAFDSPKGNTFNFPELTIYWAFLIVTCSTLIVLEVHKKVRAWILPVTIFAGYCVLLFAVFESRLFYEIPYLKSKNINYEIITLYLTIPAMFHAILDLIFKYFKPSGNRNENIQNFALSVVIPLTLYIVVVILIPLFRQKKYIQGQTEAFIVKIIVSIAIATFMFFFLRFILGSLFGKNLPKQSPLLIFLFGFIFPFIGLFLSSEYDFFGNFSYLGIYIIIALNAIGLACMLQSDKRLKLLGFLMASAGIPVVLYFFIIFLPYTPLAFIAMLIMGVGLVIMSPTVLTIIQCRIMMKELPTLIANFGKQKIIISSIVCMPIIPACYLGFCIDHKNYLNKIIAETDHFDASNQNYIDFNPEKIRYILDEMRTSNRRLSFGDFSDRLPLLSIFYDWYVFDNLQVSTKKVKEIENLFLGDYASSRSRYTPPQRLEASLTYTYETEYVKEDDFYKTQVHLSITNLQDKGMREFRSDFTLPKDVFITDYYLDIEDRRVFGILAEKGAANWIYERITNQRRDPGILQYIYDDVLSLKIFPFKKDETRTSGFTLYHRTPVHFSINDTPIAIPVESLPQNIVELSSNTFYIPNEVKQTLPKTELPVVNYFVVDNTTSGEAFREQFHKDFANLSKAQQEKSQILYVDADVNWGIPTSPKNTGFHYKKAIAQILYAHEQKNSVPYVIVYAPYEHRYTGKFTQQKLETSFPHYNLVENSHWDKKLPTTIGLVEFSKNGHTFFMQNDQKPSLISFDTTATLDRDLSGNPYLNALQLRLFHDLNDLNPSRKKTHWLQALQESFKQNVLTHSTTFISLENKGQEQQLLRRQKQIMNADYSQKVGSEYRRMSEPYFWVLLLFVLFLLRKQLSSLLIKRN
jgi:hypothetical protein